MQDEAAGAALVEQLVGDEGQLTQFVQRNSVAMGRVAAMITGNAALAEDAVQETWLAVLKGIHAFQGRSSLRTWVFRILVNRARTLLARERRMIPVSQLRAENEDDPFAGRFEHPGHPGHWTVMPLPEWGRDPEADALSGEVREVLSRAIARLVPAQREVITLRDVEGWDSGEVCNVLGVSEVHQRVLLHRARTRVRAALEAYYLKGQR